MLEMRQQINQQYFEQNKYSTNTIPSQRQNTNGINYTTNTNSYKTQYSKQSPIQIQDFTSHDGDLSKNQIQGKVPSQSNSKRNSNETIKGNKGMINQYEQNHKQQSQQHSYNNFKISTGIPSEPITNYNQQQGNNATQNRVGFQRSRIFNNHTAIGGQTSKVFNNQTSKIFNNQSSRISHNQMSRIFNNQSSKIFNNQTSFRFLANPADLSQKYQSSQNPSTVIFAIQEKAMIELEDKFQKKKKKMKDILVLKTKEEVFAKGLRHFRDAHLLRPPRNLLDKDSVMLGKYFLYFYELRQSFIWRILQKLFSYLYIIQAFIEPQTLAQSFNDDSMAHYLHIQEILILLFCIIDNILSLYVFRSSKRNNIFRFISFASQFTIFTTFLSDFIIFWHTKQLGIRFSAILRPVWLIQFHPDIFKNLKSICFSFKNVIDIFLFFIFFSCFWGYMGYNLFSEYIDDFKDDKYFVFGTVGESILGMYTLISMDTYPSIMRNIVMDNPYYLIFFLPYVAFNLFFLLFIPVAVIFDNYKQQRAQIILRDERIIKEALTYSFYCITHFNQEDYLTKDQFFHLLDAYYGKKSLRDKIDNLYCVLNIDKQDQMSLREFLDVVDLMKSSERLYQNSNAYWDYFRGFCNKYFKFDKISRSYYWNYFILLIVTVNTIMIIVYSIIPDDEQDQNTDDILTNIDIFFNSIYIFDVCVKIIGLGVNEYFSDSWNNFDFIMVMISIITIFGIKYIYFLKQAKSTKLIKLTKLQKVLKIFRSIRSLKLFKILKLGTDAIFRVQKLFHKIALCVPSIYGLLYTYTLFTFSYSIVGVHLFNTDYNDYNIFTYSRKGSPYDDNSYTDFNTIQGALLSLFQVISQSRWVDFLYGYGYKFNLGLSTAYFCFYHMFSILFFMSLLQGMIWDVFAVVENYFKEQELDEIYNAHFVNQVQSQEYIDDIDLIHDDIESQKKKLKLFDNNDYDANQPLQRTGRKSQMMKIGDLKNISSINGSAQKQNADFEVTKKQERRYEDDEDEEDSFEKTSIQNQEKHQVVQNDFQERPRLSTYHYMKQEKLEKSNKMYIDEEKDYFDCKEEQEDDEEKSSLPTKKPKEKRNNLFLEKKRSSSEDLRNQFRSLSNKFKTDSNDVLINNDNDCDEIPEEEIIKFDEGEQKPRIRLTLIEQNRFLIRFNIPELDSDNFKDSQTTQQQQTPTNYNDILMTNPNEENTYFSPNLLTEYNEDVSDHLLSNSIDSIKEPRKSKTPFQTNNQIIQTPTIIDQQKKQETISRNSIKTSESDKKEIIQNAIKHSNYNSEIFQDTLENVKIGPNISEKLHQTNNENFEANDVNLEQYNQNKKLPNYFLAQNKKNSLKSEISYKGQEQSTKITEQSPKITEQNQKITDQSPKIDEQISNIYNQDSKEQEQVSLTDLKNIKLNHQSQNVNQFNPKQNQFRRTSNQLSPTTNQLIQQNQMNEIIEEDFIKTQEVFNLSPNRSEQTSENTYYININNNQNKKSLINVNFQNEEIQNQEPQQNNFTTKVEAVQQQDPIQTKKTAGILKRSESSFIIREQEKFVTAPLENSENDFEKFISKRIQVIKYEVDFMQQLEQLEVFLQLYDQVGLKQAEMRKNRIVTKHININRFTISKQHALQKMTFLKHHPLNRNYGNRQDYLLQTEQLLGYSKAENNLQLGGGRYDQRLHPNIKQRFSQLDNYNKHQFVINQGCRNEQNSNFMSLNDIDDLESQTNKFDKHNRSYSSGKQNGVNGISHATDENFHSLNMNKDIQYSDDQTFLRMNNIFSFLLNILTNASLLDNQFLVQKLFIIEQCINQVIFGNYNENHKINHFKFVFFAPSLSKFMVLIKQDEILDSKHDIDDQIQQYNKTPIEVTSIPNEMAPWSALTKSCKNENTIYFIQSLFSNLESKSDQEIAKKISDNIQYMRGYEYCLEDLSQYQVESYQSYVYSRQNATTQHHVQQRILGQSQPFIAFICTKQTSNIKINNHIINTPKSQQNRRSNKYDQSFTNDIQQLRNGFNKIGQSRNVRSYDVPRNQISDKTIEDKQDQNQKNGKGLSRTKNSYRNQKNNESQPKSMENKTSKERIQSSETGEKQEFYKNYQKQIEQKYNSNQNSLQKSITSTTQQVNVNQQEGEKGNHPKQQIKSLYRSNIRHISSIYEKKKQFKLVREQEHVIKTYQQIQQFFSSHAHLLQGVIIRLQTQIQSHIPNYQ